MLKQYSLKTSGATYLLAYASLDLDDTLCNVE